MTSLRRAVPACFAACAAGLATMAAPAAAAPLTMMLSSAVGLSGGGNTIVGTVPGAAANTFPAGTTPTVQFQAAACATAPKPVTAIAASGSTTSAGVLTVDPATVTRISGVKIAFKVPSGPYPALDANGDASTINPSGLALAGSQATAKWSVCVYDSDTPAGTLVASAGYTLVLRPTITSILPASSPAAGGQTVTVNGTGFTVVSGPITASIGGTPLTNVRVAANGNSFTATTGPRSAEGGLALTVNTPGGTVSSLDPDHDSGSADPIPFEYLNGVSVTPATAAVGSTVTLDVIGAGFSALTFDPAGTPTSGTAHVFLVRGEYLAASNRGVAECTNVRVVTDTELVCSLNLAADALNPATSATLAGTPIPHSAYTVTVVPSGSPGAGGNAGATIVSSTATFTVSPY